MRFAHLLLTALATLFFICATAQTDESKMDKFITKLMSQMTLEEKLGQLNLLSQGDFVTGEARNSGFEEKLRAGKVGGVLNMVGAERVLRVQKAAVEQTRLGIPLLVGFDVIHGFRTIFPIPLALSASWDMTAIECAAATSTREGTAAGINWTYSPMVDICQDARWGRIAESAGEDPYLGCMIAKAMVRGIQGDGFYKDNEHMLACVKHYALYGAAEAGLDYSEADMSRITMYNEFFPPYKAAAEAGAASFMASFNDVEGIPATGSRWLMTDVLRHQWGFNGFVVSDYTGVSEMTAHGVGNKQQVAAKAIYAGVDMDMVSESYLNTLEASLKEGFIDIKTIDQACRRILEAKYKLGLFQNPYKYSNPEREKNLLYTEANQAQAEKMAEETFVLLKNSDNLLPLKGNETIALVGPLADSHGELLGSWCARGDWRLTPSLREVMTEELAATGGKLLYAKGSNVYYDKKLNQHAQYPEFDSRSSEEMVSEALDIARQADVIVCAMGETANMSGESASRANIGMPDAQRDLLRELQKLGKPIVLVLYNGRPMALAWEKQHLPAILDVWFGGSRAAKAICSTLMGRNNPSGKLTCTFPQLTGQEPMHYNHKSSGRPLGNSQWFSKYRNNYIDVSPEPCFPFGYGLSYTTFEYGPVTLSSNEMTADSKITASVQITNTGQRDGTEVVQLYLHDKVASVTRPVKELKDFCRVNIPAGKSVTVNFDITIDKLKFYNYDLQYVAEPGDFEVQVGPNSADVQATTFTLKDCSK